MKKVRRHSAGHLDETATGEANEMHSDTQDLVQQLAKEICSIVFLDINIPGITSLEAASIVKAAYPDINVLLLTLNPEERSMLHILPPEKEHPGTPRPASLTAFISQVYETALQANIKAVQKVVAFFNRRERQGIDQYGLSPREREVLDCLVDGHTYKKIADKCHISVGTVRSHIMNIYRKLEVNSRSAAIVKAMKG